MKTFTFWIAKKWFFYGTLKDFTYEFGGSWSFLKGVVRGYAFFEHLYDKSDKFDVLANFFINKTN